MTPANASTALAATLLDELRRNGVQDLVLAPGSRSAPLAFAAAGSGLRLHTRIDERSAAFLALGIAMTSRRPVGRVCATPPRACCPITSRKCCRACCAASACWCRRTAIRCARW